VANKKSGFLKNLTSYGSGFILRRLDKLILSRSPDIDNCFEKTNSMGEMEKPTNQYAVA
jgi:hypothetical protein